MVSHNLLGVAGSFILSMAAKRSCSWAANSTLTGQDVGLDKSALSAIIYLQRGAVWRRAVRRSASPSWLGSRQVRCSCGVVAVADRRGAESARCVSQLGEAFYFAVQYPIIAKPAKAGGAKL